MNKKKFSTELAYLAGLLILALGTALMERADFGLSMVVAPAYILHLKTSQYLPFFSFGMAEYTFQALLLIAMVLDDGILRHPQELSPRERLERAVYLGLDDRGGVYAKYVAGKQIL